MDSLKADLAVSPMWARPEGNVQAHLGAGKVEVSEFDPVPNHHISRDILGRGRESDSVHESQSRKRRQSSILEDWAPALLWHLQIL